MVGRMRWMFVALALGLASFSAPAQAQEIVMKIATIAPDDTPWSELLKRYAKAVEEKSGGRINVKVFLGGALGDENETVIKCKRGQVQAVAGHGARYGRRKSSPSASRTIPASRKSPAASAMASTWTAR